VRRLEAFRGAQDNIEHGRGRATIETGGSMSSPNAFARSRNGSDEVTCPSLARDEFEREAKLLPAVKLF
jgi:hypothetical protein